MESEPLNYRDLKTLLEIVTVEEKGKKGILNDESFFSDIGYEIISKSRDRKDEKKFLLTEQDTIYENFTKECIHTFTFVSTFEKSQSLCVTSTKGHSVEIGSNLGATFMGATAGVSGKYNYSKQKGKMDAKGQVEKKELHLRGEIEPSQQAIVKELTHEVQKSAEYELLLKIEANYEVPFIYQEDKHLKYQ